MSFLASIMLLLLPIIMLSMMSCTKANFSGFFADLGNEVPIEKVSYKIATPNQDTLIVWYSPYRLFENRTDFKADSIYHSEQFNWKGLGEFLYDKYQERKERRQKRKEVLEESYHYIQSRPNNNLSQNTMLLSGHKIKYRRPVMRLSQNQKARLRKNEWC